MECLQILDRARAPEVEGVLAEADVARLIPLALRDVRELVLDRRALSQRVAPRGRSDLFAEPLLELFVLSDRDRPSMPDLRGGALRSQRAAIADVGIELDDGAEREALHVSLGAFDRAVAEIEA